MSHRTRRSLTLIFLTMSVGLAGVRSLATVRRGHAAGPPPHSEIRVQDFFAALAPHGRWIQHARHGWVWSPAGVGVDWRPYTDGRWVLTDDSGWLWVSDFEWGWAPFHYGRWFFDDTEGWLWVPGTEWGPAWVAWRRGGGWLGWAPLPPEVGFGLSTGLVIPVGGLDALVAPQSWVFVDERECLAPRVRERILLPARNVTLLRETVSERGLEIVDHRVVNRGVERRELERRLGNPVPHVRLEEVRSFDELHHHWREGDRLAVFRPLVSPSHGVPPLGRSERVLPAPREFEPRHQAEIRQLEERHRVEQRQLERMHAGEMQRPQRPGPASMQELRTRHEAERGALAGQHARERSLLAGQHARERSLLAARHERETSPMSHARR